MVDYILVCKHSNSSVINQMRNADAWRQCSLLFLPFPSQFAVIAFQILCENIFSVQSSTHMIRVLHRCAPSYDAHKMLFFFLVWSIWWSVVWLRMHTKIHSKTHANRVCTRTHKIAANTRKQYCQKNQNQKKFTKNCNGKIESDKGQARCRHTTHIRFQFRIAVAFLHARTCTHHRRGIQKLVYWSRSKMHW